MDDPTRWFLVGALAASATIAGLLGAWLDGHTQPRTGSYCKQCDREHGAYEACPWRSRRDG